MEGTDRERDGTEREREGTEREREQREREKKGTQRERERRNRERERRERRERERRERREREGRRGGRREEREREKGTETEREREKGTERERKKREHREREKGTQREREKPVGAATHGTRRLAGSAAHAGPLLIDTGMADGSWCARMGSGWLAACLRLPSGWLLEQRSAWDTRTINTYLAEQWNWPEHSHSWMRAWQKMAIGCAVISATCGIQPWTSQSSRIRRMRADTRQASAELAREMTVCTGGIDMLGSAARGELSAHVQASGIGPQAMQKRAAKAHMLVDRVIAFSRESGCPKRVHMV